MKVVSSPWSVVRKSIFCFALCAMLLVFCSVVEAQQTKIPRIGFFFIGFRHQPHLESFRQGLRDVGYAEGKNISIEYRYAEGKADRLPLLASELAALDLALVITTTPEATRAVLKASSKVPIVITGFTPCVPVWPKASHSLAVMLRD